MIVILTQCFPPDHGGIESFMGGLADTLAAQGEEVLVLADRIRGDGAAPPAGYTVRRFSGARPLRRLLKRYALLRQLRRAKVTHLFADSWKSLQALPPTSAQVVVFAHGTEYPPQATFSKQRRIRRAMVRAQHIVANSRYTAGLVQPYRQEPTQLHAIPSPIFPQPEPTSASLASVHALVGDASPLLLTLCRLEARKGIDQVIRAMPAVRARFPQAAYLVAGGGDDLPRLRQLAAECGVADAVHFLGRVDASMKAALYASATLFAMPARREGNSVEGFGLTYIEAGWYGLPSLAGSEGGAVDAVTDGVTGSICHGDDAAEVQAALLRMLEDESLRRRLGDAARHRARHDLQWPATFDRYRALGILPIKDDN